MIARLPERAKLDLHATGATNSPAARQAAAALRDGDDLEHPLPLRFVRQHRPQRASGLVMRREYGDHLADVTVAHPPQHLCSSLGTLSQHKHPAARCKPRDEGTPDRGTRGSMARILVADDDRHLVELVRAMLDEAGFEVDVAHSGLAAADLIEREDFDVVVLDVLMPGMSGDALADLL